MGNREQLEIPTLEFTPVTLLDTSTSGKPCACEGNENPGTPVSDACENNKCDWIEEKSN